MEGPARPGAMEARPMIDKIGTWLSKKFKVNQDSMFRILFFISMLLYGHLILAQAGMAGPADSYPSEYEIRWVSQFPGDPSAEKPSLKDRISGLVFGQKPPMVIKPFNVVAEDLQHFWILDQGSGEVIPIRDGEEQPLKSFKKTGIELPSLVGICRIPGGDILCTDSKMSQIFRINPQEVSPFADQVSFQQPTGIAYSRATGEIWVVETAVHRITVINPKGEIVKRIGERGSGNGSFNFPTFIWIDKEGVVYIVDSMNFRVQILSKDGDFLDAFGENGDATGFMARPKGIATDSHGNIYVADALFHAVQVFDREGNFLSSFGSQGQQQGDFWMPAGIYVDEEDYIYVADSYNSRIQVFQLVKN